MASLKKRGKVHYAQYCIGGQVFRVSLKTDSLQVVKDKLRQIESSMARGADLPMPTRTPMADVVARYLEHIRATKTGNGYRVDLWYLRQIIGPICAAQAVIGCSVTAKWRMRRRPMERKRKT